MSKLVKAIHISPISSNCRRRTIPLRIFFITASMRMPQKLILGKDINTIEYYKYFRTATLYSVKQRKLSNKKDRNYS